MRKTILALMTGMLLHPCLSNAQTTKQDLRFNLCKEIFAAESLASLCISTDPASCEIPGYYLNCKSQINAARRTLQALYSAKQVSDTEYADIESVLNGLLKIAEKGNDARMLLLLQLIDNRIQRLFPTITKL